MTAPALAQSGGFRFEPNEPNVAVWPTGGDHPSIGWGAIATCCEDRSELDLHDEWFPEDGTTNRFLTARGFGAECHSTQVCPPLMTNQDADLQGGLAYAGMCNWNTIHFGAKLTATAGMATDPDIWVDCEPNYPYCCFISGGSASVYAYSALSTSLAFFVSQPGYLIVQGARTANASLGTDDDLDGVGAEVGVYAWQTLIVGDSLGAFDYPGSYDTWHESRVFGVTAGWHSFQANVYYSMAESVGDGESVSDDGWGLFILTLRFAASAAPLFDCGDVDGDDHVNITDLGAVLDAYGTSAVVDQAYDPRCDFDSDGTVDIADLNRVLENYGT
jgi:hypothetical protein